MFDGMTELTDGDEMNRILKSGIQGETKMRERTMQLFLGKKTKGHRYKWVPHHLQGEIWASMEVFGLCLGERIRVVGGKHLEMSSRSGTRLDNEDG